MAVWVSPPFCERPIVFSVKPFLCQVVAEDCLVVCMQLLRLLQRPVVGLRSRSGKMQAMARKRMGRASRGGRYADSAGVDGLHLGTHQSLAVRLHLPSLRLFLSHSGTQGYHLSNTAIFSRWGAINPQGPRSPHQPSREKHSGTFGGFSETAAMDWRWYDNRC